ncbi:MAG: hypothetical protein IKX79_01690, partial [Desulfovibrionaceae bacterium]|nr:hypothetical protein [Desulfovibrionaceae bacterium]
SDIPEWKNTDRGDRHPALSAPASSTVAPEPLMRTRYCIRYELGMCHRYQGAAPSGPLFLVNNGRRLALGFDCARCEMTVNKS